MIPIPDSRRPLLADPRTCPCPQAQRAEMHSNGGPRAVGPSHLHATARRRGAAGQCHPLTLCWHSIVACLPVHREVSPLSPACPGMPLDTDMLPKSNTVSFLYNVEPPSTTRSPHASISVRSYKTRIAGMLWIDNINEQRKAHVNGTQLARQCSSCWPVALRVRGV